MCLPLDDRGVTYAIASRTYSADPGNDVPRHGSEDDQGLTAYHLLPDESFFLVLVFLTLFYFTRVTLTCFRMVGWKRSVER